MTSESSAFGHHENNLLAGGPEHSPFQVEEDKECVAKWAPRIYTNLLEELSSSTCDPLSIVSIYCLNFNAKYSKITQSSILESTSLRVATNRTPLANSFPKILMEIKRSWNEWDEMVLAAHRELTIKPGFWDDITNRTKSCRFELNLWHLKEKKKVRKTCLTFSFPCQTNWYSVDLLSEISGNSGHYREKTVICHHFSMMLRCALSKMIFQT